MKYYLKQIKYLNEMKISDGNEQGKQFGIIGKSPSGKLYILNQNTGRVEEISESEATLLLSTTEADNNQVSGKEKSPVDKPNVNVAKDDVDEKKKYYSALCLIIRDENDYLQEWLDWHLRMGIDHIYIYDNGVDVAPVTCVLSELTDEDRKKITVTEWMGHFRHTQHDAYNHCLQHYGQDCRWIGFIDADEFVRMIDGSRKINDFLKDYERFGALHMNWIQYNANGKAMKEDLPLRVRFTRVVPDWDKCGIGKVFVQPDKTVKMNTHDAVLKPNYQTCNENFEIVTDHFEAKFSADKIVVDHYYTKSYEEWCRKIKRGVPDPIYQRKYEEFFAFNPDLQYLYNPSMLKQQKYH